MLKLLCDDTPKNLLFMDGLWKGKIKSSMFVMMLYSKNPKNIFMNYSTEIDLNWILNRPTKD